MGVPIRLLEGRAPSRVAPFGTVRFTFSGLCHKRLLVAGGPRSGFCTRSGEGRRGNHPDSSSCGHRRIPVQLARGLRCRKCPIQLCVHPAGVVPSSCHRRSWRQGNRIAEAHAWLTGRPARTPTGVPPLRGACPCPPVAYSVNAQWWLGYCSCLPVHALPWRLTPSASMRPCESHQRASGPAHGRRGFQGWKLVQLRKRAPTSHSAWTHRYVRALCSPPSCAPGDFGVRGHGHLLQLSGVGVMER